MEQDKNLTAEIQQEETLVGTIPPVTFDEFTPPSYEVEARSSDCS